MSRTSAVALLVDARQSLAAELQEKAKHAPEHSEQMLRDIERLLLDVRIRRVREFQLEYPTRVYVIVSE
ncbi:hypothetical protein [Trinickia fusca]|nr:hypothetical protein [Trinickia fusca]